MRRYQLLFDLAASVALLLPALAVRGQSVVADLGSRYVSGQLAAVIELGEQALRAPSPEPAVALLVGRAYADQRQFRQALPFLTQSFTDSRSSAEVKTWSQAYLGTCSYALQDYAAATQALQAVVSQAVTRNAVAYASKRLRLLRAQELAADWQLVETAHFRFHVQAPAHLGSVQAYAEAHERAYEVNNRFFQAALPRKADFFVWDTPAAATAVLGRNLGFTQPDCLTIHVLPNQTKGHEIAHLLLAYGLHPALETRLISEGAAVCFDQTSRDRLQAARQATNGQAAVWKMWETPQAYSDEQLYPVGGALLEYLLAHGSEDQVRQLLREQTPEVGRKLFSQQIAAFEKELARQ